MYRINQDWKEYYREEDPKRREILKKKLFQEQPDDGANEYREFLFGKRYIDEKQTEEYVDRMLYQCVNFLQLYKNARLFRRSSLREIREVMSMFGFDRCQNYGEAGEAALYWEIRNAAARYLKSCKDPSYRRKIFGLMGTDDKDRTYQAAKDIWEMTQGLSKKYELEEELRIWCDAVTAEFTEKTPEGERMLRQIAAEK